MAESLGVSAVLTLSSFSDFHVGDAFHVPPTVTCRCEVDSY